MPKASSIVNRFERAPHSRNLLGRTHHRDLIVFSLDATRVGRSRVVRRENAAVYALDIFIIFRDTSLQIYSRRKLARHGPTCITLRHGRHIAGPVALILDSLQLNFILRFLIQTLYGLTVLQSFGWIRRKHDFALFYGDDVVLFFVHHDIMFEKSCGLVQLGLIYKRVGHILFQLRLNHGGINPIFGLSTSGRILLFDSLV